MLSMSIRSVAWVWRRLWDPTPTINSGVFISDLVATLYIVGSSKESVLSTIHRSVLVGLLIALLLVVSACEFRSDAVRVENQSSQTLTLLKVAGDVRIELTVLRPSEVYLDRLECVTADFVAESVDGEELARRPGPLCQGDPPWVLTDDLLGGG